MANTDAPVLDQGSAELHRTAQALSGYRHLVFSLTCRLHRAGSKRSLFLAVAGLGWIGS
jgi:hypothetical protein